MNKQSLIALTILLSVVLSSCSTYQFTSLNSNLPNPYSDYFLYEDDTLEVQFSFAGENCPLQISIFNKTDNPVFINWAESAVIINGQSKPINPMTSILSANISSTSYNWTEHIESTNGSINGTIKHPSQTGFIPPNATINMQSHNLSHRFMDVIKADSIVKVDIEDNGYLVGVKKHVFTKEHSPLRVKCFLTYNNQTKTSRQHIQGEFWCESVYKKVGQTMSPKGNCFYVSRLNAAGGVVLTAALVGMTIFAVEKEKFESNLDY